MPKTIGAEQARGFYLDWECGCNLCEDEYGGSIFGWYVEEFMRKQGWSQEDIDRREDFFEVNRERRGW